MNDAEAVKRAVASGSGLAVVSRSAVRHELEEGSLAELKAEEWGQLRRGIFMLWRLDGHLSKNAEAFMHFLQEAFDDTLADEEKPHDS
ncbi:MAG: hypothetical protein ACFWTZ_04460 [Burkholderia sp.]|jgi:DNA-binding transcriptional LysR family regulator